MYQPVSDSDLMKSEITYRPESYTKDVPADKNGECGELHKEEKILSEPDIPVTYRGWNLNKRGKNRKGETIFNLTKKVEGRKRQKYLGVWNQEKADQIIDEMEHVTAGVR